MEARMVYALVNQQVSTNTINMLRYEMIDEEALILLFEDADGIRWLIDTEISAQDIWGIIRVYMGITIDNYLPRLDNNLNIIPYEEGELIN